MMNLLCWCDETGTAYRENGAARKHPIKKKVMIAALDA
jgi:hypothetical protein